MMNHEAYRSWLALSEGQAQLQQLYGQGEGVFSSQSARCLRLIDRHQAAFGSGPLCLISAPGRTEIVGNHTDHNRGRVLAAAVNLDTLAAASPRADMTVRLQSEGYSPLEISLSQLDPKPGEEGSTAALIRGVAARMADLGHKIGGFDAAVSSQVLHGSGLSSSAAFEMAMVGVLDALYNGFSLGAQLRAQVGKYAENVYFGKPSGLMDQMASSVGGLVTMDFATDDPQITALPFSFAASGFHLVVVDTRGHHGDLTPAYSAIQAEMQAVAESMGAEVLRERSLADLLDALPGIRQKTGDRAVLRALHFYHENQRVTKAVAALKTEDLPLFFRMVRESGLSSWTLLQNLYTETESQPLALALALAQESLQGEGACRVHGGGFAGTTLNFVPDGKIQAFTRLMDSLFGPDCCHVLDVRSQGVVWLGAKA